MNNSYQSQEQFYAVHTTMCSMHANTDITVYVAITL